MKSDERNNIQFLLNKVKQQEETISQLVRIVAATNQRISKLASQGIEQHR